MFTFFSQTSVLLLGSFRNMPEYFQKEGGSAFNLIYLVPESKPVNPVKIPYKLLYHK